jgi:hypothetical protein
MQSACAVLFCRMCPVWLYHIFFHIISQIVRISLKVIEHKICVLIFFTKCVEKFLIVGRIQQDIIINVRRFSCKVPANLSDFNENLVFGQIWEIYSNIKFHENPSGGSRDFPCEQTDEQAWWSLPSIFKILRKRLNKENVIFSLFPNPLFQSRHMIQKS